jgi:hypothetical protein
MKRLIDDINGVKTYHEYDHNTGKSVIESVQDVEPFFERSKRLADGLNKKEEWWYIGSIPDVVIMQWAQECGHKPYSKGWMQYATKQLNDRDYRKLNPNNIKL